MLLHEFTGASKDFGYEQQHREQKNDLRSIGLNADWEVSDEFNLGFDFHNSRARSLPDDPITGGGETAFSLAGKVPSTCSSATAPTPTGGHACVNSHQFLDADVPVQQRPADRRAARCSRTRSRRYADTGGNSDYTFDQTSLGSQVLRIAYQDQNTDIKQARIDGKFKFEGGSIVRLRRRNPRDGVASARFGRLPGHG